jgi:hypothetical protein
MTLIAAAGTTEAEQLPDGFEAGMLDYRARTSIRDLIALHGFEEARQMVAMYLNDECERKTNARLSGH